MKTAPFEVPYARPGGLLNVEPSPGAAPVLAGAGHDSATFSLIRFTKAYGEIAGCR